jgi:hypothetical protein
MPPSIEVFIQPIRDNMAAQVAVESLIMLSVVDVLMGLANACFIQHYYSSHELREGITRKLMNLGMVCAASVIDSMLIGGLDLSSMSIPIPDGSVVVAISITFCAMELSSIAEIWAEAHPDASDSPIWQMLAHSKDGLHKGGEE